MVEPGEQKALHIITMNDFIILIFYPNLFSLYNKSKSYQSFFRKLNQLVSSKLIKKISLHSSEKNLISLVPYTLEPIRILWLTAVFVVES